MCLLPDVLMIEGMNKLTRTTLSLAAIVTIGAGTFSVAGTASANDWRSKTTLRSADGNQLGTVWFKSHGGHTEVRVTLKRLPSGATLDAFHGFHIHANNDPANGDGCLADPLLASTTWFVSADGHWKAGTETHGAHLGDMPSVYANADGSVETRFTIDRIDRSQLAGKVVVLHAAADNFGNVPVGPAADQYAANSAGATTKTQNTGNAGDRIACGVIGGG
jgi:superoxide dismutase, Cu-Zn family